MRSAKLGNHLKLGPGAGTLEKRIQQMDKAAKLPINRLFMISQDTVRGRLLISRVNVPLPFRVS